MAQIEKRDLVLPPGAFAYMQDVTTGMVKTFVGPCVINQTAQELPVIYDVNDKRFRICTSLEEAVCKVPVAVEGSYLVLLNPAVPSGEEHPQPGNSGKPSPSLQVGRKINIPGPVMFALWPGQEGKVVKGHHLRSNQYLIARVYNEEEARRNWPRAVVKGAEEDTTIAVPTDLTVGRQIVIKGTEVSFYMPPTGVSVVPDEKGVYVREALTLERLEYAILIDEDGNKRYERGPQVVFPEPTEQFAESGNSIKFRAVELNEIQGLHIKVIAPYEENGVPHKEGDELFLTGKDVQIYFPREEHAIIKYDGAAKHFATAVPVGEGRYVMNRLTGEIETVRGPNMLLPDPRTRVIVRRVLSDRECGMWYPGNDEVREYNSGLRQVVSQAPTTRSGVVSEGDYARHSRGGRSNLMKGGAVAYSANMAMEESRSTRDQRVVAEELSRNATYTEPRTITLSSKLAGVPGIEVWPGYAVLVKNKTGARRVVVGPASILLDYDETLEVMELSTGKPKSTDHLLRTVFLKHAQNLVTDVISGVETTDHFTLTLTLQFRARFTGDDKLRWFEGGNYVKLLCDHVRSMVKARVRGFNLRDFYSKSEEILRNLILGEKVEGGSRPGLRFEENGLSVYELEVLSVHIEDEDVQELLVGAQQQTMRDELEVESGKRHAETTIAVEEINRKVMTARTETELVKAAQNERIARAAHEAKIQTAIRLLEELGRRIENENASREHDHKLAMSRLETEKELFTFAKTKADDDAHRMLETERQRGLIAVERLKAISPELALALTELLDERKMAALIESFGGLAALKLKGVLDTATELFDFVPSDKMQIVSQRKRAVRQPQADGGNGK